MARSSKAFVNCFSKPFSPIMSSGFWYSASSLSSSSFSIAIGSPLSSFPMAVYTFCFTPSTLPIAHLFGGAVAQQSAPFLLLLQLRLPRPIAPRIGIDDRHMPQTAAVLVDGLGIVGRIHQIVEIGDAPGA